MTEAGPRPHSLEPIMSIIKVTSQAQIKANQCNFSVRSIFFIDINFIWACIHETFSILKTLLIYGLLQVENTTCMSSKVQAFESWKKRWKLVGFLAEKIVLSVLVLQRKQLRKPSWTTVKRFAQESRKFQFFPLYSWILHHVKDLWKKRNLLKEFRCFREDGIMCLVACQR